MTTTPEADRLAAELLPCEHRGCYEHMSDDGDFVQHGPKCAARFRPAVAQALAAKDAEIARLKKSAEEDAEELFKIEDGFNKQIERLGLERDAVIAERQQLEAANAELLCAAKGVIAWDRQNTKDAGIESADWCGLARAMKALRLAVRLCATQTKAQAALTPATEPTGAKG